MRHGRAVKTAVPCLVHAVISSDGSMENNELTASTDTLPEGNGQSVHDEPLAVDLPASRPKTLSNFYPLWSFVSMRM
jgi:hypothetical protein